MRTTLLAAVFHWSIFLGGVAVEAVAEESKLKFRSSDEPAFATTSLSQVDEANDWTQYNYDNRGWRLNEAERVLSPANIGKLQRLWSFPPNGTKIGMVHATPVVVKGYVYFGTATDAAFYRLKPNGELDWVYRNVVDGKPAARGRLSPWGTRDLVAGGFYNSPLVFRGAVYVGDTSGYLYCLDAETGNERWKIDMRDSRQFPFAHEANQTMGSPILADDKVIFTGGAYEHDLGRHEDYKCCTGRGYVVALAPDTGELQWAFVLGPKPERLDPPVVVTDSWGKHVFHYGPSTSSIWSTPSYDPESNLIFFGTDTNNSPRRPTDDDKRLHTAESCAVVALNVRDGTKKWMTQINPEDVWNYAFRSYDPDTGRYLDCSIGDTPKIYWIDIEGRKTKVVGVGCKNGAFYVLHANDGRIFQHTPVYNGTPTDPPNPTPDPRTLALPSSLGGLQTGCAFDGKAVYVNGIDWVEGLGATIVEPPFDRQPPPSAGRVTSISPDTRTENWRYETPRTQHVFWKGRTIGDPVGSGLAIANGVIYFTTFFGHKLVALDARNGKELFTYKLPDVICGPSISDGKVYVGFGECVMDLKMAEDVSGGVYCFGLPPDSQR